MAEEEIASGGDGGSEAIESDSGGSEGRSLGSILRFHKPGGPTKAGPGAGRIDPPSASASGRPDSGVSHHVSGTVAGSGQANPGAEPDPFASPEATRDNDSGRRSGIGNSQDLPERNSGLGQSGIGGDPRGSATESAEEGAQLENSFLRTFAGAQGAIVEKPSTIFVPAPTTKAGVTKPRGVTPPKTPPKMDQAGLTAEEQANFVMALMELSELADNGIWYLGVDTDPDVPDIKGNPGIPIWSMTQKEAQKVTQSFMVMGKIRPEVYKAMRAVTEAHFHLQAGLILGSRFFQTGVALFQTGINFRMSKAAWTNQIVKAAKQNG